MEAREFALPTRLLFGAGSLATIAGLVDGNVFLVSDAGVVAAGHVARVEQLLAARGHRVQRYDGVRSNPTEEDVVACLTEFRRSFGGDEPGWVVAIGGGSAIDVAKACTMLACGGGRMRDYVGRNAIQVDRPRLIAIPTTAGTGSETQSFALIGDQETGQKMACGGTAPVCAILDPELTLTQPRLVTICAGLDTLAHAVETAVTRRRSPFSAMLSHAAFRLVERHLPTVIAQPDDLDARAGMLHASALAGFAIENSMLGAAHSMANPLTRQFAIAHGHAVGLTLPHVVAFNAGDPVAESRYADLARDVGLAGSAEGDAVAVGRLVGRLRELVALSGFTPTFAEVSRSAVDGLAAEASTQWTAQFNPRPIAAADFRALFLQVVS